MVAWSDGSFVFEPGELAVYDNFRHTPEGVSGEQLVLCQLPRPLGFASQGEHAAGAETQLRGFDLCGRSLALTQPPSQLLDDLRRGAGGGCAWQLGEHLQQSRADAAACCRLQRKSLAGVH